MSDIPKLTFGLDAASVRLPSAAGALIAQALRGIRFSLGDEKITQGEIAEVLKDRGFAFEREFHLARRDRIDFLVVGDVGLEVKIKSGKLDLYRQCERYCKHPVISELVLVTNVATGWPPTLAGKPQHVVNLARAWL